MPKFEFLCKLLHGLPYFLRINGSSKKFQKAIFLQDISNSCHEVTAIGLEPPQKDFGEKNSTILGASASQSCSIKGGAADIQAML